MTDHEALEPCRKCGAVCRVEDFNGSTVWMCSQHKWFGGNCPSETAYLTDAAWNTRARPTLPASDEVREKVALALVNYDCAQTDCPALSSVEEFRFDADRDEYLGRAEAALSAIPADPVVERMAEALERISGSAVLLLGRHWHHVVTEMQKVAREALAAYRGK